MAETVDLGYNTCIKQGTKTFAGVTSDDLDVSSEQKESITKADQGKKRIKIVRKPVTLTISGLCTTDSTTTVLDREDIMDLGLSKEPFEVTYAVDSRTYSGTGWATGYKETTPADETDPTYSLVISVPDGLEKDDANANANL